MIVFSLMKITKYVIRVFFLFLFDCFYYFTFPFEDSIRRKLEDKYFKQTSVDKLNQEDQVKSHTEVCN